MGDNTNIESVTAMADENLTPDLSAMTAEQQKCDEKTGHEWLRHAYEPDTNWGGFMECKLCGWAQADDGDYGSDFDDNYM